MVPIIQLDFFFFGKSLAEILNRYAYIVVYQPRQFVHYPAFFLLIQYWNVKFIVVHKMMNDGMEDAWKRKSCNHKIVRQVYRRSFLLCFPIVNLSLYMVCLISYGTRVISVLTFSFSSHAGLLAYFRLHLVKVGDLLSKVRALVHIQYILTFTKPQRLDLL